MKKEKGLSQPNLRYTVRWVSTWGRDSFEWHELDVSGVPFLEGVGWDVGYLTNEEAKGRYIYFDRGSIVSGKGLGFFEPRQFSFANTIDPEKFEMLWHLYRRQEDKD